MQLIKSDKIIAEEEAMQLADAKLKAYEAKVLKLKFDESTAKKIALEIVEDEMKVLNSNISIQTAKMSMEERGQMSVANALAYKVLQKILARMNETIED